MTSNIIEKTLQFVKESIEKEGIDASHDFLHIQRVLSVARQLSDEEKVIDDVEREVNMHDFTHS